MKVTFIEHSSFMVEMEQNVLLFDYYQGEIPSFDGSKTLYVFASHSHADHYDPAIWKLKEVIFLSIQKITAISTCKEMEFMP